MRLLFYSPVHFERWDWRSSIERGIGGSETSHVEMAWRLARRGHEVLSYAPIPDDCPGEWRGTTWKRFEDADFSLPGLWVLYRCPSDVAKFGARRDDQTLWFMCQDWDYPWRQGDWLERVDRVLVLSEAHATWLRRQHPDLAVLHRKLWITANAVKVDLIRAVERQVGTAEPVAFDVGGALETSEALRDLARRFARSGHPIHIVPHLNGAGPEATAMYEALLRQWHVPFRAVHVTSGADPAMDKLAVLRRLGCRVLYDDRPETIAAVNAAGLVGVLVRPGETPAEPPLRGATVVRDPRRLMFASSPDRGLRSLLWIFARAKEYVPDLSLHVFYGFDNLDKLSKKYGAAWAPMRRLKKELLAEMARLGVVHHGRVDQMTLYTEWLKSGLWVYPTNFWETGCITAQEAQCLGAIPITKAAWAQGEKTMHGVLIPGDAETDKLVQARYVAELVRLASEPALQDAQRPQMMADARYRFNWERAVDQWEQAILGIPEHVETQFWFQRKHARGRVLNIGCDVDFPHFKQTLGAVNVDVTDLNPGTGQATAADVIADARALPEFLAGRFDSVILGDILEHFEEDADIHLALKEAMNCLRPDGRIIVTVPQDDRSAEVQMAHGMRLDAYVHGTKTWHWRPITRDLLESWLGATGLTAERWEQIDYTHCLGWGVVCRA